jgi:hypothetical protein
MKMKLAARLECLEAKVNPGDTLPEHLIDLDQRVVSLGLVPATVRETAISQGISLAEAAWAILGMEQRVFKHQLKETVSSVR